MAASFKTTKFQMSSIKDEYCCRSCQPLIKIQRNLPSPHEWRHNTSDSRFRSLQVSKILNQVCFLLQDAREMVVEQIWDTTAADSTSEELAYFARLKFAVPIAQSCIHDLPLQHMLDWLLNPHGPPVIEGDELNVQGHVPHRAFTLLAAPKFFVKSWMHAFSQPYDRDRGGVHSSLC